MKIYLINNDEDCYLYNFVWKWTKKDIFKIKYISGCKHQFDFLLNLNNFVIFPVVTMVSLFKQHLVFCFLYLDVSDRNVSISSVFDHLDKQWRNRVDKVTLLSFVGCFHSYISYNLILNWVYLLMHGSYQQFYEGYIKVSFFMLLFWK